MFTLSSTGLNLPHRSNPEIHIPIQIETSNEKYPTATTTHDANAAACDDDGHIFVYDSDPPQNYEQSASKINLFTVYYIYLSLI